MKIKFTCKKTYLKEHSLDDWNSLNDGMKKILETEYRLQKLNHFEYLVFSGGYYSEDQGWITAEDHFQLMLVDKNIISKKINKANKKIDKLFPKNEEWD